ncbi:hypothetical protein SAMN04487949_1308 [Halogranum gelatinilyticum]|uniref:DUF7527 domain-containing protein n=1 Tax=Halogranum gelatinilyticum TaxID=660521 RepID=A0A1G9RH04_9EURY|nr:hypothetical protein SAMN04487949_1308 [Halogranum gelatinilyticum]
MTETEPVAEDPTAEQAVDDSPEDSASATDVETTESAEATRSEATETTEPTVEPEPAPDPDAGDEDPLAAASAATNGETDEDVFSEEAQWREATSIPALDPQDSATERDEGGPTVQQAAVRRRDESARSQRRPRQQQSERTQPPQRQQETERSATESETAPQVGQLKARLEAVAEEKSELEAARERLVAEVDRLETERDQAASERDEYREQASALESRVSSLEAEVDRLEAELEEARAAVADTGGAATETMSAEAALDGTNLFVRYGSKSGGTLEKAHAGEVNRSEVNENLRLEHHTGFETEGVAVDGEPYEEFLQGSIEYGFVRWVVEDLLYEIRETGNRNSLDELFDAIPKIDRAELRGDVTLKYTENGEEHREQQSFDVVLRDRMGNPLLVANLNGSRDPASEGMMRSLVEHTSRLRESNDSLGAAFLVTASYFAPDALETAADATGGGLLSRGRRKSFVKLSRKQGFHLCLVETRNGDFHVNVPEL